MPKRDMDERFAIEGDPEDALRALLGVDPEGNCEHCGHPMTTHRVTPHGRKEALTCQVERCECHFDRRRSV